MSNSNPVDIIERIDQWHVEDDFGGHEGDLLADARAEIVRLRAALAKYRQTRDGVYFNGGSTLYCPHGHKVIRPLWDGAYCSDCWQDHKDVFGKVIGGAAIWYDAAELTAGQPEGGKDNP